MDFGWVDGSTRLYSHGPYLHKLSLLFGLGLFGYLLNTQ